MSTPTRESTDTELARLYAERDALQQRLNAADERRDVLEGLLRTSLLAMKRIYQAGYDRIVDAGGTCDTPEYMMQHDPTAHDIRVALKPAAGADYRKSCEASHKALSMENQRILAPGQFKCLACGDIHPGSGNLPCPKMSPTA